MSLDFVQFICFGFY